MFGEEQAVRSTDTHTYIYSMTRLAKINKKQFHMSFLSEFVVSSSVKEPIKFR